MGESGSGGVKERGRGEGGREGGREWASQGGSE